MRIEDAPFYLTLDPERLGGRDPVDVCRSALAGGANVVELQTSAPSGQARELAARLAAACRDEDALLVVRRDPGLARSSGAHGVRMDHHGESIGDARVRLGEGGIVGLWASSVDEARLGEAIGADYVLLDLACVGADAVREARRRVSIPVFPAGPLTEATARELIREGCYRFCVGEVVTGSDDVREAAAAFSRLLGRTI